ncbi:MAG: hypothetical protein H8E22_06240 [Candidatus Cloacimonetes bacterium]|nr:hypothetical protein [Candidatus Cloacimonadota bacterium]
MVKAKTPFKKIVGYSLLGLGIIGLFTPFLQGILLIAVGLGLIDNKKLNELVDKLKKKYFPKLKMKKKISEDCSGEEES